MSLFQNGLKPPSHGHVYYVRLKTPAGKFYKLGYTSAGSVNERLSFNGSTDAQYVDKVLIFTRLENAFQVEQKIHALHSSDRAFGKYSAVDGLPLSRNGQSELYHKDILQLDPESSSSKSFFEKFKTINFYETAIRGKHPAVVLLTFPVALVLAIGILMLVAVTYPITWVLDRDDEKNHKYIRDAKARRSLQVEKDLAERKLLIKKLVAGNQIDVKLRMISDDST